MHITVKEFEKLSTNELFEIYKLRAKVFVVEQNCAYQDIDEKDLKAFHVLMLDNHLLLGYCRIIPPGFAYPEVAIGRVVVDSKSRGNGSGKKLMDYAISKSLELFPNQQLLISAQLYLLKFYTDLGFESEGENYLEDDIPHVQMRYTLNNQ